MYLFQIYVLFICYRLRNLKFFIINGFIFNGFYKSYLYLFFFFSFSIFFFFLFLQEENL